MTGENTVVIKADGYADLTVTVMLDSAEEPGETIKEVPAVLSYGASSHAIYFDKLGTNTAAKAYLNAVAKVTVNDTEYQKSAYTSWLEDNEYGILNDSDKYIKLDGTSFDNSGDTTIVIEADGYKTLTVTVHSDGTYESFTSNPGESDGNQPAAGKDAPSVSGVSKDYSNNYVLGFDGISDDSWKKIVSSGEAIVKVNDVTYSQKGEYDFGLSDNQYQWSNSGSYGYPELTLKQTAFTKDQNTITISAEGYKDLTITIDKYGNIVE